MPNQDDIRWLLKGLDAWNRRRAEDPVWRPDLSKAPIPLLLEEHQRLTESGKPDLRSYDLSSTDFSGAFLHGVDMTDADMSFADFKQSRLDGGILMRVKCLTTNFEGASLQEAVLKEAELFSTQFTDAKLVGANLEGAACFLTNFRGANLADTNFSGATLELAQLVGADLTNARLWEARRLYVGRPPWGYSKLDLREDELIESVSALMNHMEALEGNYPLREGYEPTLLYYRGESENFPNLAPSVMRTSEPREYPLRPSEAEMLVDVMTRRPSDFAEESTALGQLMTAQHFGLPTRLLDVTRNPLVALFHATGRKNKTDESPGRLHAFAVPKSMVKPYTSHTVSVIANFTRLQRSEQNLLLTKTEECTEKDNDLPPSASDRPLRHSGYLSTMSHLVQYIRLEHPSFEERVDPYDLFRVFVVEPQRSNERVVAQSAAFLLSAFHERFDETEVRCRTEQLPIYHQYTFEIPQERKDSIRRQLRSLNISEEAMYPGLEAAAKAVKLEYGGTK